MKFHQLADLVMTSTRSLLSRSWVHEALRRGLYLSVCVMLTGTVTAMGAGGSGAGGSGTGGSSGGGGTGGSSGTGGTGGAGGGGGGAAVESSLPRQEVGESVFKVYNQGVALMRAKNFIAAQVSSNRRSVIIRTLPRRITTSDSRFVRRARRTIRKPSNTTIRRFNSNRPWLRPMRIGECSLRKWAGKPPLKRTWLLSRN